MTMRQAQAQAVRWWGRRGLVQHREHKGVHHFAVGTLALGMLHNVLGASARSWEEAFENAAKHWPAGSHPL